MKNSTLNRILAISIVVALASCAGSKKFNYQEAYKFKTINYSKEKVADQTVQEKVAPPEILEVSTEPVGSQEAISKKVEIAEQHLLEKIDLSQSEAADISKEELAEKIGTLSGKEKRTLVRDLKKDMKEIRKMESEINDINTTSDLQATDEVEGNTRLGIIIGVGGLIALILGLIIAGTFGQVLAIIGGIALIVGLVLILLDVI